MTAVSAPSAVEQVLLVSNVLWAMALGGFLGLERQRSNKASGVRTMMLVSGAAAFVSALGVWVADAYSLGDPTRGIHAVITGIGFLGAGAIVHGTENGISGMTSAATIFFAASVGAAIPLGFGPAATAVTMVGILILQLMARVVPRSK